MRIEIIWIAAVATPPLAMWAWLTIASIRDRAKIRRRLSVIGERYGRNGS